jgi:hypothetical protein
VRGDVCGVQVQYDDAGERHGREEKKERKKEKARRHYEMTQPDVNHLRAWWSVSDDARGHARTAAHQLLLSCSIQCTTTRRRRRGETIGSSLAFSYSSIGSNCAGGRAVSPAYARRAAHDVPWPSRS